MQAGLLAGDIGGTHARLALFDPAEPDAGLKDQVTLLCRDASGVADLLCRYTRLHPVAIETASLAVAGPMEEGRGTITNLGWAVDASALARELGLRAVYILNDLEAVGYGLGALQPADLVTLNAGAAGARGNLAVIAAGTGLGECACYWDGTRHHPFASQGGHTDFAPRSTLEFDLSRYLSARHAHVSYERVVSGPGLLEIHGFLGATGQGHEPVSVTSAITGADSSEPIIAAATGGQSQRCTMAARIFLSLLAAEAGNLALKVLARGGVYVAGGMIRRLLPLLSAAEFMADFAAKGSMRELLAAIPVHVITNDHVGLLGAARYGQEMGSE
jgi:glucokinase